MLDTPPPSPVERIQASWADQAGIQLLVKRDDLLQAGPGNALCGNKWRKLKYNLRAARQGGHHQLLTYGGAYSNHIAAVAAAGQAFRFATIGVIRGEAPPRMGATLRFAAACGMQLHFISRSAFRQKDSPALRSELKDNYGAYFELPEGGTNDLALKGCAEIIPETTAQLGTAPDYWLCSAGTGGTLAGLVLGIEGQQGKAIGFSALKGSFLAEDVRQLLKAKGEALDGRWAMENSFHFGGYAKCPPSLVHYINTFYDQYGIPLDPVYTGKLFYGIEQLARTGYFPRGSTLLALHSGGLQGLQGFQERLGPVFHF
ncbi:1-aminocyclopropane-1-carboxylate deaminase/D-cysteine desulfhydrase [Phaeodactylibacter luteus]|uniref:Pyridoxal-phosphate dependent enzyme n=1 Tax=Phaeodactylibacter luteus TaxID=1564516 RepID=A0A5C6RJZ0_9BACT|nr:pyridoxal-phosphate dependent enzyme [Phaeodactylibacter luteus]TXB62547.1 pyridoxal-phosphate dependent enzyme [Phaeodactylibacter luteus]